MAHSKLFQPFFSVNISLSRFEDTAANSTDLDHAFDCSAVRIILVAATAYVRPWSVIVCGCFDEPSEPEKFISGLKTNFNLGLDNSAYKTLNHFFFITLYLQYLLILQYFK